MCGLAKINHLILRIFQSYKNRKKEMKKTQTGASLESLKNSGEVSVVKAERLREEELQLIRSERQC